QHDGIGNEDVIHGATSRPGVNPLPSLWRWITPGVRLSVPRFTLEQVLVDVLDHEVLALFAERRFHHRFEGVHRSLDAAIHQQQVVGYEKVYGRKAHTQPPLESLAVDVGPQESDIIAQLHRPLKKGNTEEGGDLLSMLLQG